MMMLAAFVRPCVGEPASGSRRMASRPLAAHPAAASSSSSGTGSGAEPLSDGGAGGRAAPSVDTVSETLCFVPSLAATTTSVIGSSAAGAAEAGTAKAAAAEAAHVESSGAVALLNVGWLDLQLGWRPKEVKKLPGPPLFSLRGEPFERSRFVMAERSTVTIAICLPLVYSF